MKKMCIRRSGNPNKKWATKLQNLVRNMKRREKWDQCADPASSHLLCSFDRDQWNHWLAVLVPANIIRRVRTHITQDLRKTFVDKKTLESVSLQTLTTSAFLPFNVCSSFCNVSLSPTTPLRKRTPGICCNGQSSGTHNSTLWSPLSPRSPSPNPCFGDLPQWH